MALFNRLGGMFTGLSVNIPPSLLNNAILTYSHSSSLI